MLNMAIEETLKTLECDELGETDIRLVKMLMRDRLEKYYTSKIEAKFDTIELQDLWFYLKINFLSRLTSYGDHEAKIMLGKELTANATKLRNPNYKQVRAI